MANPLYQMMSGGAPSLNQMIQQIKANPQQLLARRYKLPQNIDLRNPDNILDYLVKSGQVTQDQYNSAFQRAEQLGLRR